MSTLDSDLNFILIVQPHPELSDSDLNFILIVQPHPESSDSDLNFTLIVQLHPEPSDKMAGHKTIIPILLKSLEKPTHCRGIVSEDYTRIAYILDYLYLSERLSYYYKVALLFFFIVLIIT